MTIISEIEKFSSEEDKPILLALLKKYHMESGWKLVAKSRFKRYGKPSYQVNRVWFPTPEGIAIYNQLINKCKHEWICIGSYASWCKHCGTLRYEYRDWSETVFKVNYKYTKPNYLENKQGIQKCQ